MAKKQYITIPLTKGLDQATDPKLTQPDGLLRLNNAEVDYIGQIKKRTGSTQLAATYSDLKYMGSYGGKLTYIDTDVHVQETIDDAAFTQVTSDQNIMPWSYTEKVTETTDQDFIEGISQVQFGDFRIVTYKQQTVNDNMKLDNSSAVQTAAPEFTIKVYKLDSDLLIASESFDSVTNYKASIRPLVSGDHCYVIYENDDGYPAYRIIDATAGTISIEYVIATSAMNATDPAWSVVADSTQSDGFYMVKNDVLGEGITEYKLYAPWDQGDTYTLTTGTYTLTDGTQRRVVSLNIVRKSATSFHVVGQCVEDATTISATTTQELFGYAMADDLTESALKFINIISYVAVGSLCKIGVINHSSSAISTVMYFSAYFRDGTNLDKMGIYKVTYITTGFGSISTFKQGSCLASKPFGDPTGDYWILAIPAMHHSPYTKDSISEVKISNTGIYSALIIHHDGTIQGKLSDQNSMLALTTGMAAYGNTDSFLQAIYEDSAVTGKYYCGIPEFLTNEFKRINYVLAATYTTEYIRITSCALFDIQLQPEYSLIDNQDSILIPGSLPLIFDGKQCKELGFTYQPSSPIVVKHDAVTGDALAQVYQCCYLYEWTDGNGKLYRSAPSETISVTPSNGKSIIWTVFLSEMINKDNLNVVFYRTNAGGSVFYRVYEQLVATTNYTAIWIDDAIEQDESSPEIYTTGSELPASVFPGNNKMCLHQNRLFMVSLENPGSEIYYSKPFEYLMGIELNTTMNIKIPSLGGDILDIVCINDTLFAFKHDTVYTITGNGKNTDGSGDNYIYSKTPYKGVGSLGITASTAYGVVFMSHKSLEIISNNGKISNIGDSFRYDGDFNSSEWNSLSYLPHKEILLLLGDNYSMIYDMKHGIASKWDWAGTNATVFGDENHDYAWLDSSNKINIADSTVYTDNDANYKVEVETGWINFGDMIGITLIDKFHIIGDVANLAVGETAPTLTIKQAYNYVTEWLKSNTYAVHTKIGSSVTNASHYGDGLTSQQHNNLLIEGGIPYYGRRARSIRLHIEWTDDTAGIMLTAVAFTILSTGGAPFVPVGQQVS